MNNPVIHEIVSKGVEKMLNESTIPMTLHVRILASFAKKYAALEAHVTSLEKGQQGLPGRDGRHGTVGNHGRDGKSGSHKAVGRDILGLIPKPRDGRDGKDGLNASVDIDAIVEAAIEKISSEKRLDISHIRNSQSFRMGKTSYKTEELMHGGGSGISLGSIMSPLTGAIDNSNTTFTFVRSPILVVVNGQSYRNGAGVTVTNTTAVIGGPAGVGGDVYAIG